MFYSLWFAAAMIGAACGYSDVIIPMKPEEFMHNKFLLQGVDMAINQLNAKNHRRENKFRLVVEKIDSASKQKTDLWLYRVHVNVFESNCENTDANEGKKIDACPAKAAAEARKCKFVIRSRPYLPDKSRRVKITGIYC